MLRTWFCDHPRPAAPARAGLSGVTDPQHHISWDREPTWGETQGLQPRGQLCQCKQVSQGPNQRSEELVVFSALKNSIRIRLGEDRSETSREVISKGGFFKHTIHTRNCRSKKPFGVLSSVPWLLPVDVLNRLPWEPGAPLCQKSQKGLTLCLP